MEISVEPTPERPKILWVDDDPEALLAAARFFKKQKIELLTATSLRGAKELIAQTAFAVIVAGQILQNESGVELLAYVKEHAPATTRILLSGAVDNAVNEAAVNRGSVFRVISKPWENSELLFDMQKAIEHYNLRATQNHLLRQVRNQNKKLEEFTMGLEQLVSERTISAEQSKDEVEQKLARMRSLIRFIKDLSIATSTEELISLIKKELKPFHELRTPILAYLTPARKPMVLYFQGRQVVEKEARHSWSKSVRLRINEIDDRKYLASEFGRPSVKVLAVPLKRRGGESESDTDVPATIFFEHNLPDDAIEKFLAFIGEHLQPVSIALDRILLEYNLKSTSFQWESTFDGIKDPIAIVDIDYSVVRSNRQFPKGTYEKTCYKSFAENESPCRGCPMASALATGMAQRGQIKRGQRIYDVYSYPIRLQGDAVSTNVINHYVDVTAARDLHGRVVQSEKIAAIGLLAGNIAHELNNPLTGIRSLAQVLLSEIPKGERVHDDVVEVEQAAARSQKIIENLLGFSKAGSADKQVKVSLSEIVRRTLPMLKTAMRDHRSEIELDETDAQVRVEPHLMQQVVFNLVNNACQAMTERGTISIETKQVQNKGSRWMELRVGDTGPGIPTEIRESIFEPFFTTKARGQGTGLGLSMSQDIIQKFGGEIRVQSEPGQGAEFIVSLPIVSIHTSEAS
jgi:two-component system NtrC family sensor kinase